MFSHQCQCVISIFIFICLKTTGSTEIPSNCHPNIDIRFGDGNNSLNKSQVLKNKKPHAEELSYDNVAYGLLSTADLALKLAGNECRQDICLWAQLGIDLDDSTVTTLAYKALINLPYGLRLLLCSDVIIRSIKFQEIVFADEHHENKVQTAITKSVEREAYMWRFEPVDDVKRLHFRIRNVKTNQYLSAERKFSSINDGLRRVVKTDAMKSDIWELKMLTDWNGNFNRFMIMNLNLGEYLYASRGFCYDKVADFRKDCATRPLFTWEYKTSKEAEEDEYNQFIIDEYTLD